MERLLECSSTREIHHCLDTLPEKLDDHYAQAWQRATGQGNMYKRRKAEHIFIWTIMVEQPLTLQALSEAISISMRTDSELGDLEAVSPVEILTICAGLIKVEGATYARLRGDEYTDAVSPKAKVSTVHTSVSEYFYDKKHLYFPAGDQIIAETCARVMQSLAIEPSWGLTPLSSVLIEA